MIDVLVFGEIGLVAACRGPGGMPAEIPFGVIRAPRNPEGNVVAVEIEQTPSRTVALRGPMVPRMAYPAGAARSGVPHLKIDTTGFVDTGYACRRESKTMALTAPPAGVVSIGGYRFVVRELHDLVSQVETGSGALAVLPDVHAGHRLAGIAADHDTVEGTLARLGANPLLVGAFNKHRRPAA
jgi:hypothetical protein